MTVNKDTRTERDKIIDKLLLLYVVGKLEKAGQPVTEERIQNIVYIIQKTMEHQGIETFHYPDWEWKGRGLIIDRKEGYANE